jgi:enoyl-CoA hydratase/carnithine racemase
MSKNRSSSPGYESMDGSVTGRQHFAAMGDSVLLENTGPVATLVLNRPERRNAIDASVLDALRVHLASIAERSEVRAVILRGAGGAFSSGIDHALLAELFQKSREVPFRHLHAGLIAVFEAIERLEKPVIAAISKYAVGLALELALACDFRVATPDAKLGLPEVAFGIIPDGGGTTRLVRTVGLQRARELILTGKIIDGARAAEIGLVSELAPDPVAAAEKLAAHFARLPAKGIGLAKAMVLRSAEVDALTSLRLEGWAQSILLEDPSLADNFPSALAFIKEQL